jgi:hypothetical protein
MIACLQRAFRVLPEEGRKLFLFASLAGLLQAGVAIGMTAADALFLTHLGPEKLPVVYLCMPAVMLLYAPVYSVLLAKFGVDRLIQGTLGVLVLGGVFFGLSGQWIGETTPWLLYAMKFYAGLWFIALYTVFWNFADDYFSILDGKRLYGLIAAGGATGAMGGAALVTGLSHVFPPGNLFFAWALLALLTLPVFALLRRRFGKIEAENPAEREPPGAWPLLRFVGETFRASRFAVALTLVCFFAVNLAGLLEYLSMGVLSRGKSPAELAQLLGTLHAAANLFTLVINLALFSRIVGWLGVGGTALVLPVVYLAAFVVFHLQHGALAAIFAFYAYQSVLPAIEYNNVNLLFNALPAQVKPQLRTFVEAMAEPVATAVAGLFLLSWGGVLGGENIALAGLLAACGAFAVAVVLKFDYVASLARNLRQDWLDFTPPDAGWGALIGESDRALLRDTSANGSPAERLLAVDLLWRTRDPQARPALLAFASHATPAEMDRLRPALSFMLQRDDTATLAETLLWLEGDRSPGRPELLDAFTSAGLFPVRQRRDWKQSRHPSGVATTAVAHWHGTNLADAAQAIAAVRGLLAGSAADRRWALHAIGDFGRVHFAHDLLPFLEDPDPELRLETLRALRKLASPELAPILGRILPRLGDASAEERHLMLAIAERAGDIHAVPGLLAAAAHFSAAENRQLEALVAGLGLKSIPIVIHLLRNTGAAHLSRSVAARVLGRIAMPQLLLVAGEVIDTELTRARDSVVASRSISAVAAGGDGLAVLARFHHDSAAESLELALELLSLMGRLPDFDLIRASLSFANPRDRANAIETIQQSCPRPLFRRLLFLIEHTALERGPNATESVDTLPLETILRRATASNVGLECTAALVVFLERRLPGGAGLLRARLDRTESPRLLSRLVELLPCFTSGRPPPADHVVGRVATLLRSELFRHARVLALEYLAERATERRWSADALVYDAGEPADDLLFVVAAGNVDIVSPVRAWQASVGDVFGERVLMGEGKRRERAVAHGDVRVLALTGATVARAVGIFPALGISLYRFKTISAIA